MSQEETTPAHAAVRNELLVRYLDAWLPQVLHGHKRVTYVDCSPDTSSARAAARVILEFEDLLPRHAVTMVVTTPGEVLPEPPPGLDIRHADGPVLGTLKETKSLGTPTFAFVRQPVPAELLSTVADTKSSELMVCADPAPSLGTRFVSQVELVDRSGRAELLLFGTASEKSLEKFKDELWALDEYAGIRLRDPRDSQATLLDISVTPQLGPLRRAVSDHVTEAGGATLAELRRWTVQETIYRAADATKAVQTLITSGMLTREPIGGRLSPDTAILPLPAASSADIELSDIDE